jgi:hypothetical protein
MASPFVPKICRSPDRCQHPVAENGYFCANHFTMLPNELRHLVLAYPWKPGPAPEGRNQAIYRACASLRATLDVREPLDEPAG